MFSSPGQSHRSCGVVGFSISTGSIAGLARPNACRERRGPVVAQTATAPVRGVGQSRCVTAVVLSRGAVPPRLVRTIRPVAGRRPIVWGRTEPWRDRCRAVARGGAAPVCEGDPARGGLPHPYVGAIRPGGGSSVALSPGEVPPRFVGAIRPVSGRCPIVWGRTERLSHSDERGHRAG